MPERSYTSGNQYRYGFNGKEQDKEVVHYDYGFRIYDPRIVRFKSVDPLTKGYPQLTPYQFASNSPIANIDLDGGEAKYYNIVIAETFDGKGKLIQSTKTTTYDETKEAGWHLHGIIPWYTSSGKLGDGTLYSVTKVKKYDADNGVQHSEISKIGAIYTPPPPKVTKEHPASSFSFGIQVFGSGYDPDEAPTNKATPDMDVMTFNFKEFQEIMEPVFLGMDVKSPTGLIPPTIDDLIEHVGEYELDKAVEKLNAKWTEQEEEKQNPSTFCRIHQGTFEKKNGVLTDKETKKSAKDTVDFHSQKDTPKK